MNFVKKLSVLMKTRIIVALILLAGVLTSYGIYKHTQAQLGGLLPFGGEVLSAEFCPCSGDFMLTIGPPNGGTFMYNLGSQAYQSFNLPQTGVWAIGLYNPIGGGCYIPAPGTCAVIPTTGIITPTVGTSPLF